MAVNESKIRKEIMNNIVIIFRKIIKYKIKKDK